jgi:cadmium resistance protein CadD (predicted permease)
VSDYGYTIALTAAVFVGASIDDFMFLVCLLTGARARPYGVMLAKFVNAAVVVACAAVLAAVLASSAAKIGNALVVGSVPLALGLYRLVQARLRPKNATPAPHEPLAGESFWRCFVVFGAGSLDNVAAYTSLFAASAASVAATSMATILALTVVLCGAAWLVVTQQWRMFRSAWRLDGFVPYLLIGLGIRAIAAAH